MLFAACNDWIFDVYQGNDLYLRQKFLVIRSRTNSVGNPRQQIILII